MNFSRRDYEFVLEKLYFRDWIKIVDTWILTINIINLQIRQIVWKTPENFDHLIWWYRLSHNLANLQIYNTFWIFLAGRNFVIFRSTRPCVLVINIRYVLLLLFKTFWHYFFHAEICCFRCLRVLSAKLSFSWLQ